MDPSILRNIPKALDITDGLGLHREAVEVPLDTCEGGRVTIEGKKLVVILPETDVDTFLTNLPETARNLQGFDHLQRADP